MRVCWFDLSLQTFHTFAEFTYGKRVNKAFKGTEKATDLLQTHFGRNQWR